MSRLVRMVCSTCGSEDVYADAYAEWDVANQCWKVANTFDKGAHCGACDGETRIDEVPDDSGQAALAAEFRAAASHPDLQIDADARVSLGDDDGAYVQGWLWVSNCELPEKESE